MHVCRLIAIATLSLAATVASARNHVEHITLPENDGRDLPFSDAVRVGDTVYLSGQLGVLPGSSTVVPGGIGPETEQTLRNVESVLAHLNLGFEHLVRCQVMLADIADWPAFNAIYRRIVPSPYPARSALAGSGLALGARVELECTAVIPEGVSTTPRGGQCLGRGQYCGAEAPCCSGLECVPAGSVYTGTLKCLERSRP